MSIFVRPSLTHILKGNIFFSVDTESLSELEFSFRQCDLLKKKKNTFYCVLNLTYAWSNPFVFGLLYRELLIVNYRRKSNTDQAAKL